VIGGIILLAEQERERAQQRIPEEPRKREQREKERIGHRSRRSFAMTGNLVGSKMSGILDQEHPLKYFPTNHSSF